jgi:PAS domain S-box-containing protein
MHSSQHPRSLLLVEDNPEDMVVLRRYLSRSQQHRYITREARTGKQALAQCQEEHFDCIVLDYNLPDMKGTVFLDALRQQGTHPFLPVVVQTGLGNETIAVQLMKRGAQDYILKEQLSPELLCHTIESAIETMAMQRLLEEQRQELAQQSRAYQMLAENSPDVIERIDAQFRHVYANSALTKITGIPIEAMLGKTAREVGLPEDLCNQWEEHLATVLATKQALQFEFLFVSAEREYVYQENLAPEFDERGTVISVLAIGRDVTVRRNLERRTHEALSALLMMAEQLVALEIAPILTEEVPLSIRQLADLTSRVLDCEGTVLVVLEKGSEVIEHIVSSRFEIALEQDILSSVQRKHLSEYIPERQVVQQLRAGKVARLEIRHSFPRALHLYPHQKQTLLVPLFIRNELVGLISLYPSNPRHDYGEDEIALAEAVGKLAALVIEREQLLFEREEAHANTLAARETARNMDEFIGIISHELKTPLTSIKGNVQLAKRQVHRVLAGAGRDPLSPMMESIQETLDRAERQVNIQNRLINDLLDASRIRADKLELQCDLCDIVVIVQEVVEDQMRLMPTRTIRFSSAVAEALVQADAQRIGQVVNNYLSNALKYSEASSTVEVDVEREGAFVRIAVRDEGPGLAPEVQEHLWERFYRVPEVKVKSGSSVGLGLGLHICQTLIERQSGRVGVQSIQGQGSTFWFTLPLAE